MSDTTRSVERIGEVDLNDRALDLLHALELVFHNYPRTLGTIILGAPGIGKRENVIKYSEKEAEKLGKTPVIIREERAARSPDEFEKLIMDIIENPGKYYVITVIPFYAALPDEIPRMPRILDVALLTINDIYGALIIDGVLRADDVTKRNFLLSIFEQRAIGNAKLSPNVRVIGLDSIISESELTTPSVVSLLWTLVGKTMVVYVKAAPVESWYRYMEESTQGQWYKDVYAFLKRYPNYFCNLSLLEPLRGPVPRAWTILAIDLYRNKNEVESLLKSEESRRTLIGIASSYVGVDAAIQLVAFLSKPVVSVEDAIKDPSLLDKVAEDLDLAFRFGVHLAQAIDQAVKEGKDLFPYLKVMVELMEKTSKDVGVFVLDMLSDTALLKLKEFADRGLASGDPDINAVSRKLQETMLIAFLSRIKS